MRPLLHFMVCTGARVSEALDLDWRDVDLEGGRVIFWMTKGGGTRKAALPDAAVAVLSSLSHRDGLVFRRPDGEPYADKGRVEGGQIKTAFRNACRRANVGAWEKVTTKDGEKQVFRPSITPHGLRHTWATWFYALSRDPLLLKQEGDWSSIALVERYAHLMPESEIRHIERVWGARHPRLGALRKRAPSVQRRRKNA